MSKATKKPAAKRAKRAKAVDKGQPAPTSYGPDVLPPPVRRAAKLSPAAEKFMRDHGCEHLTDDPKAARLMRKYLRLNEDAKALFSKADSILGELLRSLGCGKTVKIGNSRVGIVVDQFADKNVIWRAHAARRYTIQTVGEKG